MDLLPNRRGWAHYGALALGLLMAVFGLLMTIGILGSSVESFRTTGPRHIPNPSTEEILSDPAPYVHMIQTARSARMHGWKASAFFCTASFRVLLVVSALGLIAALTTPGKPRFLRFEDWRAFPDLSKTAWRDFAFVVASTLFFLCGHWIAKAQVPDISRPPALPSNGLAVHRLLASEASGMVLAARSSLVVGGLSVIVFLVIAYRIGRAWWRGFRAERRRLRAEANASTVKQF